MNHHNMEKYLLQSNQNVNKLTSSEKVLLKDKLKSLNMLTVRPELVDADIIDIIVNSNFKYNPRATTKTVSELETLVSLQSLHMTVPISVGLIVSLGTQFSQET